MDRPPFSWSKSRLEIFNNCKRQYWFQYYGYWGGWFAHKSSMRTQRIYYARNFQTHQQIAGTVVHSVIKQSLQELFEEPILILADIFEKAEEELKIIIHNTNSRKCYNTKNSIAFLERLNNTFSDEIIKKTGFIIQNSLNFWYENIEKLQVAELITLDDVENGYFDTELVFKNSENTFWFRTYGVIDLAYKDFEGKYHIVDWKTGENNGEESVKIQLLTYAFWLNIKHNISIENMIFDVWYLDKKQTVSYIYTEDDFIKHYSYILKTAEEMYNLDMKAEKEFPFVSEDKIDSCKTCKFQHICDFNTQKTIL